MQAAVVILLDPPPYNYVRNLQLKINKLFGAKEPLKLEPHITIKYKFDTSDILSIEKYFDQLVSQTESFEIDLKYIDSFEKNVIFLDVEKMIF